MLTRYDLYRACVQDPARMVRFVQAVHGGRARVLREDFSGPASLSGAWVKLSARHTAVAVDRDPEPLAHARKHPRVTLRVADVMKRKDRADCVALFNFAACEIHTRAGLVEYFKHLRKCLLPTGVVVMDIYGGENAFTPGAVDAKHKTADGRKIVYTWEQVDADAATGLVRNAMHFEIAAARGRKAQSEQLKWPRAFEYHWRLWSIPELRDALAEAGFARSEVHAGMGDAVDGSGRLHARAMGPDERLEADWVAYVVGRLA